MTNPVNVSATSVSNETTDVNNKFKYTVPSFKADAQNNKQKHWVIWAIQLIQKFSASLTDETRESLINSLKQQQHEQKNNASNEAVKRLKVVLLQDRANVNPIMLDNMRSDMLAVIGKYVEIDDDALELNLDQNKSRIALIANIAMFKEDEIAELVQDEVTTESTMIPETVSENDSDYAAESVTHKAKNTPTNNDENTLLNESLDDLIENELKESDSQLTEHAAS